MIQTRVLTLGCLVVLLSIACASDVSEDFITFNRNTASSRQSRAQLKDLPTPAFEDVPAEGIYHSAADLPTDLAANGSRIAYGNNASPGQFPYAAFLFGKSFSCSASLISPRVVLTAAHCVYKNTWTTKAGDLRVMLGSPDYYSAKPYAVKSMTIPSYNYYTNYGDLALLQLEKPAPYTPVPIASASSSLSGVNKLTVMGWGLNEQGKMTSTLRYVTMSTLTAGQCANQNSYYIGGQVPADHICLGLDPGRESSCSGDSGGPFVTSINNPIQVALVSYGPASSKCGGGGNLDVATSIIYWSDWIQNVLSLYNLRGSSTPTRRNTVEDKQCYSGATLKSLSASNAAECCEACRQLGSCAAWTWTTSKQCALKSSRGSKTSSSSCISGYY